MQQILYSVPNVVHADSIGFRNLYSMHLCQGFVCALQVIDS